jgi:hypothetical protein
MVVVKELLGNIELGEDTAKVLEGNEELVNLVAKLVAQKREANNEAKNYREEFGGFKTKYEQLEAQIKLEQEQKLKEKGEYEKLYNELKGTTEQKEKQIRQLIIEKELGMKAVKAGLKKPEYLKLFDVSTLEIDDNLNIKGLDESFNAFFENNKDLFTANDIKSSAIVDNSQPKLASEGSTNELEKAKKQFEVSRSDKDLARYVMLKRLEKEK